MAEVNHSSVVAHLGPGGLMSIMDHLNKLLQRQQHLYNKERKSEIMSEVSKLKYTSKVFHGNARIEDEVAKVKLSRYAHEELFQKEFKSSTNLSHRYLEESQTHEVWPTGEIACTSNVIKIEVGQRCEYKFRINNDCQCG